MAVSTTPLGFKKPETTTELVKRGAAMISENAQAAEDRLQEDRVRLDAIETTNTAAGQLAAEHSAALQDLETQVAQSATQHFDGGGPGTVYAPEQLIDGGTV